MSGSGRAQARTLSAVLIATDDERIQQAAHRFGATVRLTRADHPSGTDRVAEVAETEIADLYVNIQGDEPLIDPLAIDAASSSLLVDDPEAPMATLIRRIEDPEEWTNPNVVKAVGDHNGRALYFSRSPIPNDLDGRSARFKHIGLYVYRRAFLLGYPRMRIGPLERAERLEQLRALENGHAIRLVETEYDSLGVDTPEDLIRVERICQTLATT